MTMTTSKDRQQGRRRGDPQHKEKTRTKMTTRCGGEEEEEGRDERGQDGDNVLPEEHQQASLRATPFLQVGISVGLAVARQVLEHQELAGNNRVVECGLLLRDAGRDRLHKRVLVQVVEKGQRQPPAPRFNLVSGWVDHAVQCGAPPVVGPAAHEITEVDHKAILHEGHVMPGGLVPVLGDLEARSARPEDCERAVVGVRGAAD
mmetsp:Transcript_90172/g.250504  ORF Transcript_90172/g.250504 Transcript_90172/m.250504 type:complete len:204 (+) Transcript_90172:440-1051(+)